MGNYGELWGIMGEFGWNYGEVWGIMGGLWGVVGELWGIMGNYGELWGIMGIMGNYGELWGIMGNYGELWDLISCVADRCFLSSYGPLLPRRTCQTFILTTLFFMCDLPTYTRPPRNTFPRGSWQSK